MWVSTLWIVCQRVITILNFCLNFKQLGRRPAVDERKTFREVLPTVNLCLNVIATSYLVCLGNDVDLNLRPLSVVLFVVDVGQDFGGCRTGLWGSVMSITIREWSASIRILSSNRHAITLIRIDVAADLASLTVTLWHVARDFLLIRGARL